MKRTSVFLSFVLAILGLCSVFVFAGCDVNMETLTKSLNQVDEVYTNNSDVFSEGALGSEGISTKYIVDYGTEVSAYINSSNSKYEEFKELRDKYNIMLAVSQKYIDEYKQYILNYESHSKFSKDARNAVNILNSSANDFVKVSQSFFTARKEMISYFVRFKGENEPSKEVMESNLLVFKRAFGNFVSANIKVASDLAKAIELTEIFDTLKNTQTSKKDVELVKDYIEVKMLSFYNEYYVNKIHSKLTWSLYKTKTSDVVNLYNNFETSFSEYKQNIVCANTNYKDFAEGQIKNLFSVTEEFLKEQESFFEALNDFDFEKWATEYDCDVEKYLQKNERAKIDLYKMQQFVKTTTPNFIDEVVSQLY